ncbi:MAG: LysE family transporter [Candidatus Omnitrophica bacterium]|nr:LysE family transporter [Candidatus Omnitrophota bacterium]
MLLGIFTGLLAALLGWQINLIAIHRGLGRGQAAAFFIGLGAALADLVFIALAFFGSVRLLQHPESWRLIKWMGIITIVAVSLQILFHQVSHKIEEPYKARKLAKNIFLGFLVVIANPAVFVLWVGVVSFILTHFPEMVSRANFYFFFPAGFMMGASAWFLFLSLWIMPRIKKLGERSLHIISKISAVALLIAAVFLIFEKF